MATTTASPTVRRSGSNCRGGPSASTGTAVPAIHSVIVIAAPSVQRQREAAARVLPELRYLAADGDVAHAGDTGDLGRHLPARPGTVAQLAVIVATPGP